VPDVAMQKWKLGNRGLEVSEMGLGCMTMTGGYGQSPVRGHGSRCYGKAAEVAGVAGVETLS
jgi:aryl-alcohol dehydrogenase-like predicted oxidoreductase